MIIGLLTFIAVALAVIAHRLYYIRHDFRTYAREQYAFALVTMWYQMALTSKIEAANKCAKEQ